MINLYQLFYNLTHYCAEIEHLNVIGKYCSNQDGAMAGFPMWDDIKELRYLKQPKPKDFDFLIWTLQQISHKCGGDNSNRIEYLCESSLRFIEDIKSELISRKEIEDYPLDKFVQAENTMVLIHPQKICKLWLAVSSICLADVEDQVDTALNQLREIIEDAKMHVPDEYERFAKIRPVD